VALLSLFLALEFIMLPHMFFRLTMSWSSAKVCLGMLCCICLVILLFAKVWKFLVMFCLISEAHVSYFSSLFATASCALPRPDLYICVFGTILRVRVKASYGLTKGRILKRSKANNWVILGYTLALEYNPNTLVNEIIECLD